MLDVLYKLLMFYINAWCFMKRLKVVPVSLSVLGRGSCSGKSQFILGKGDNYLTASLLIARFTMRNLVIKHT